MIETLDNNERRKNAEIKDFTIDETRIYFTGHKNALSDFLGCIRSCMFLSAYYNYILYRHTQQVFTVH